jgi:hypothetical protein
LAAVVLCLAAFVVLKGLLREYAQRCHARVRSEQETYIALLERSNRTLMRQAFRRDTGLPHDEIDHLLEEYLADVLAELRLFRERVRGDSWSA